MGSCCCYGSGNKKEDNKKEDSPQVVNIYQSDGTERGSQSSGRKLITDEKLAEEERQAVKGGESAYAKQKRAFNQKNLKIKSLTDSQYNKSGLIDKESKEFRAVKNFLKTKDYEVICSIGSGNYAEVYKAYGRRFDKFVAVKVIALTPENINYRQKFLPREIDVLKDCKHPNIIKMYEICQIKNKVFMIMELAENGTLADWLRLKGAFTESTAHKMFTKVLGALHHMHSQGIAHRDLKLENILISSYINPKISDFSFAIRVTDGQKSTTHCGSIPYFAPELLSKEPYNPLMSDIWSLGICLYIMVNDGLPFKLGNDSLMLQKQLNREWSFKPKIDSQISPELKSMLKKMLEPNPRARITTARLLNDPWITNFSDKH